MTREEHIRKLEDARDHALRSAYSWMDAAKNKAVDEDGTRNVARQLNSYKIWLEHAQLTTDMIAALKAETDPPAVPSRPPLRRRELDLD